MRSTWRRSPRSATIAVPAAPTTTASSPEAKTNKEALRCLKRRISDVVYRQLLADAERQAKAGPGGQTGTTLQSSVTGPTPTAGSSDKPQPGPATEATPTPFGPRVDRGGAICIGEPAVGSAGRAPRC